jgi:SAM-dependent methyltransferase
MTGDPKERFSDRVENYVRYRPSYPESLPRVLEEETGLDPSWVVADVGSGTGISTVPFLEYGCTVFAVEPNAEMREAAEHLLAGRPAFRSVAGSAEATGLDAESVDLVTAGQAFHWFEPAASREEFRRILREPKWVSLFWNARRTHGNDFLREYEELLERFGTDYEAVRHDAQRDRIEAFFGGDFELRVEPNEQILTGVGLRGRVLSSSYVPAPGHPDFEPMLAAIDELFERHALEGAVRLAYDTEIYVGRL